MNLLSALTTLGAFVGLLTGIFTVWDRYASGRPIAYIDFKKEGGRLYPYLIISNPGDYSAFILSATVIPDVYFLLRGTELNNLFEDQFSGIAYWPVGSKQNVEFRLAERFKGGESRALEDMPVRFSIEWRRGNSTGLRQLPVHVRTRTSIISKLSNKS